MSKVWIIIRKVATDELTVVKVRVGHYSPADPEYRWAGWWESEKEARQALVEMSEDVRSQLHGEPRPINGTPGPESVASLFRLKR